MPIYEYQCVNCDHKLECFQKIDEAPLLTCPECKTDSLRKLVSAASFRLKGTGWYATDFKDKQKKPGAGKEESKPDQETSKPDQEDAKPAEKPAAAAATGTQEASGSA